MFLFINTVMKDLICNRDFGLIKMRFQVKLEDLENVNVSDFTGVGETGWNSS